MNDIWEGGQLHIWYDVLEDIMEGCGMVEYVYGVV